MANLIITVISIALVAVAALMGAFYGGGAFLDGQAKAQANQLISSAEQIAAAWQLYTVDKGGDKFLPSWGQALTGASELTPKYLSVFPKPAPELLASFNGTWWPIRNDDAGWATANRSGDMIVLWLDATNSKTKGICEEIAHMARGPAAVPLTHGTLLTTQRFDCRAALPTYYTIGYRVF